MIKYLFCFSIAILTMSFACGQAPPADRPQLENPDFDEKLTGLLHFSVPVIGVQELKNIQDEVHIFDTRNEEEYQVSHIPNAKFLGYRSFDPGKVESVSKQDTIVLYCSVGYRSEKIGERLKEMGFQYVFNVYGSIFEWANQGYPLVDATGQRTQKIHTYNQNWSQWVKEGDLRKIW